MSSLFVIHSMSSCSWAWCHLVGGGVGNQHCVHKMKKTRKKCTWGAQTTSFGPPTYGHPPCHIAPWYHPASSCLQQWSVQWWWWSLSPCPVILSLSLVPLSFHHCHLSPHLLLVILFPSSLLVLHGHLVSLLFLLIPSPPLLLVVWFPACLVVVVQSPASLSFCPPFPPRLPHCLPSPGCSRTCTLYSPCEQSLTAVVGGAGCRWHHGSMLVGVVVPPPFEAV